MVDEILDEALDEVANPQQDKSVYYPLRYVGPSAASLLPPRQPAIHTTQKVKVSWGMMRIVPYKCNVMHYESA